MKFPAPVTAEQYRALEAVAQRIYTYLPHFAYLVKMPAGLETKTGALGASWTGPYQPFYKISRSIASVDAARLEDAKQEAKLVRLQLFPGTDLDRLRQRLEVLGAGRVVGAQDHPRFPRMRLLMTPEEIVRHRDALALLPEVFWIELPRRRRRPLRPRRAHRVRPGLER